MPELPEVETVCRGIAPHLTGARIVDFVARRGDLRSRLPDRLAARVAGRTVCAVRRRAKYILIDLAPAPPAPAETLVVHLGMSGRLIVRDPDGSAPGRHEHIAFATDRGKEIRFSDPRRFGMVDLIDTAALDAAPRFAALGPEPLSEAFSAASLAAALAGSRTSIKVALLDQHRVAGIGNIYACEALFLAGLSPRRSAHTVQGDRAGRLAAAIRTVLERSIADGGSTLRDHVQPGGELGYFQTRFNVYDRAGTTCPTPGCGQAVRRIVQAGRSTFYCTRCQR